MLLAFMDLGIISLEISLLATNMSSKIVPKEIYSQVAQTSYARM
jgi:hypothetical protein